MFKNCLKIAFRNLIKNKPYAFISIFGLAIGMAVCILLILYVQHELSYDRFHINADTIYRLCNPEHPYHSPQTAKILADNLPEIKGYARILKQGDQIVQHKEKRFKEKELIWADVGLFKMFSFKFIHGNPETALQDPLTIVISEKIAHKYFGNENPLDKVFTLNNEHNYTITGVMEDMPQNSHFFSMDIVCVLIPRSMNAPLFSLSMSRGRCIPSKILPRSPGPRVTESGVMRLVTCSPSLKPDVSSYTCINA